MRREELHLSDIVDAADAIQRFVQGVRRKDFLGDELRQSAVLQKLTVIGEATARLPKGFKDQHPAVEWLDIVGFRNIAVQEYFAVDWAIVWISATQDAPDLRQKAAKIVADEYPSH